jgi:hypothetical protein
MFVALTTFLATRHAMWRDEVRAFSVATHARSWLDLFTSIHQDGHPVLWYAILRVGYEITHSPLVLPVAALVIAWITAFLILRSAPFPFWIRLLIVFSPFLAHELSVVARNYGIGVLFMVLACILFPTRGERPLRFGIVLALLANTSVHAAVAVLLLGFVWIASDVQSPASRRALARPASLAAITIGIAGTAFAFWSAHVPPDMAYAVGWSRLSPDKWSALPLDPGKGLMGIQLANIASAQVLPWAHLGVNPALACRLIVDIALLGIVWSLRRNPVCLAAAVLAVVSFEVIFRLIYSGGLRHEGILAFILISLVWIASEDSSSRSPSERRSIALGLLPMLLFQAVALPVTVRRVLLHPTSSSRSFAALIDRTPAWRGAILAAEPDYMMEPMPYYVGNRVFMPRQRAFDYRVYFDRGARRKLEMSLGGLLDVVDSLSCATRRPVLLAIGYHKILSDTAGKEHPSYGDEFQWNSAERSRLFNEGKLVGSFFNAIGDENYSVFELAQPAAATCKANNIRD